MPFVQHLGVRGCTSLCLEALRYLLQQPVKIHQVYLITFLHRHGFLIRNETGWWAIKSGFSSGYPGEGPRGLSTALTALLDADIYPEERCVSNKFMDKLDNSQLVPADIGKLKTTASPRSSIFRYVLNPDGSQGQTRDLWDIVSPIPFALLDPRLRDLATNFQDDPDGRLRTGFCRLESTLRERTGLAEYGSKLFTAAFAKSMARLTWENCETGEIQGRINMFHSIYQTYRNPRAHKELESRLSSAIRELLLLNHLFVLEAEAIEQNDTPNARHGQPQ